MKQEQFDIFSISEDERMFEGVGIHTVIMDRGEFMVIDVHECGGFTILEHVIPDHDPQTGRA